MQLTRITKIHRSIIYHSIPLGCIFALLALFTTIISSNKCYAAEPSISLSIAESSISNTGVVGEEITISNNVTIEGTLINNYNLQISGNPTLEGSTTINSITSDKAALDNNEWGYKWDNTGNYKGISTTPTTIITNTGLDSNGSISYTKPLTFSAKFSDQAEAGHYKTSVNLLLTTTPKALVTYTLSYDGNGGNSNLKSESCSTYNESCEIIISATATNPRPKYFFEGWADSSTANSSDYDNGNTIELTSDKTLYSVWRIEPLTESDLTPAFNSIANMQDMTSAVCAAQPFGAYRDLTDIRDGTKYRVVKFRDGRCWMAQELKISGTIYATNSDFNTPASIFVPNTKSGFTESNQYTLRGYVTNNIGYYNWYTITAQSGTADLQYSDSSTSICPSGWSLPSGGESGDFTAFLKQEGVLDISDGPVASDKLQNMPYNFTFTEYVVGSVFSADNAGRWWTSTAIGSTSAYVFSVTKIGVFNRGTTARYPGYVARCISRI